MTVCVMGMYELPTLQAYTDGPTVALNHLAEADANVPEFNFSVSL